MIEKTLKRPYRKVYRPVLMDRVDPKVHAGTVIKAGAVVTVTHYVGPFRWIEDEHGNCMSVFKTSLVSVKEDKS